MKKLSILPILSLLLLVPFASALMTFQNDYLEIGLAEKNPSTWEIIPGGANGKVILSYSVNFIDRLKNFFLQTPLSQTARANIYGLNPGWNYTLIYYGFNEHNDEWDFATCITSGKTSTQGYLKMVSGNFNWTPFVNNGRNEKFWIVRSEDVNCETNRMLAWNPSEYLFESSVI